ncbi:MAG TPA: hypothetical protein PKC20_12025, partial [Burkholderiaceae bacterium]|nr:hypothetical protein [Burkholderiaceae bacterium]
EARGAYVASAGGEALDASLLLLAELNFLPADDPRFASTVERLMPVASWSVRARLKPPPASRGRRG